jgi:hypothetical protein
VTKIEQDFRPIGSRPIDERSSVAITREFAFIRCAILVDAFVEVGLCPE